MRGFTGRDQVWCPVAKRVKSGVEYLSTDSTLELNNPAASCEYQHPAWRFFLKNVTPECHYRGSSQNPPAVRPVEPPLNACGNDGLWMRDYLNAASWESTHMQPPRPSRRPHFYRPSLSKP